MDNVFMKFGENWVDDESISDEEKLAYFDTLEPATVLNIFQKIELDMKNAQEAKIALENEINSEKLG